MPADRSDDGAEIGNSVAERTRVERLAKIGLADLPTKEHGYGAFFSLHARNTRDVYHPRLEAFL